MSRLVLNLSLLAGLAFFGYSSAEEASQAGALELKRVCDSFLVTLKKEGVAEKYAAHKQFAKKLFADSRGDKSFRDKTGNCRLAMVERLVTGPDVALQLADEMSRGLYIRSPELLPHSLQLVEIYSEKERQVYSPGGLVETPESDIKAEAEAISKQIQAIEEVDPGDALEFISKHIEHSHHAFSEALAALEAEEKAELLSLLYPQTTGELNMGHRFADSKKGRRTADLLEKMNRRKLFTAARTISFLANPALLATLGKLKSNEGLPIVAGMSGKLSAKLEAAHGNILVGGTDANEYNLDELADVAVVIDLGGNDTYIEGTTTEKRPVLVVIDLAGDDTYRGTNPGIQGSAILGVSMLIDQAGNDTYAAVDVAQGSALGGVGILIDNAGNDSYVGDRRVQGQASGGFGLLLDQSGDDKYRAALLAQGVGGPLGVGVLLDVAGADHYFAGGKYPGGYDDTPGFGGWSQGVGVGPRGVANGGIGMILDGGGDDMYEADYFSHGGGYWFSAGVARDFGGNDQRIGATRESFDGTPRTEPRFVRWGTGYGCHYAAGFVIDDEGDDTYQADFAVIAYAWDIAVAGICDLAGNDRYITQGSGVCEAHNSAVAFLYDKSGKDVYQGGIASTTETTDYHPEGGSGNYTFLLDEAGDDQYGHDLKNGAEQLRGWGGAILIDKP